ncbi:MAG: glycosyltransferase family 2 protein [Desulfarculaceae bacterium]|nr:glycosyltransferase family 2 protein [Desulfarculaceae bacterium]
MPPEPTVSVVIPAYNMAGSLPRAIKSVLSQTYSDLELIVVDDGSRDDPAGAMAKIADPRLRMIRLKAKQGAAHARNTGAQSASGRLLAFLDADDYWLPEKLQAQMKCLEAAPQRARACCTGYLYCRPPAAEREVRLPNLGDGWLRRFLDVCQVSPGSTLLVEREVFLSLGGLDVDLERFEDWDWLLAYCSQYQLEVVSRPLAVVENSGWPSPETVLAAGEMILAKKSEFLRTSLGDEAIRRLASSVQIEVAIAHIKAGRHLAAAGSLLQAGQRSPGRLMDFILHALKWRLR